MIENKTYLFKEEFCPLLSIPKNQQDRRLDELLNWLKIFFNYDFIKGKGIPHIIIIKEQYCDYEPLPRKSKIPEIKAFYEQETEHIITYKPRNTGSNIAREISKQNNKYKHAEGTIANYIRPILKRNYVVGEREWCKINYEHLTYDPIDEKELKFLQEQFKKYLSSNNVAETIGDVEAGYISQDDGYKRLKSYYNDAIIAFQNKFGFRPYKAGELIRKAWVED